MFAGIVSASVSVIADALNNLSDAGSSVVTFLGFKLASRPADREHPFGHGRYEYVAGLGISVVILLMGVELIKSSIEKIITPEDKTAFSTLSLAIMIASIFVKLWMYFFNSGLSRKINSTALKAAALDSLTDCIATSVVIIGLFLPQQEFRLTVGSACVFRCSYFLRVSAHSERAFHRSSAKRPTLNLLMRLRKQC